MKIMLIIVLCFFSSFSKAEEADLRKIDFMITEIENMYNFGIEIHFKYDLNKIEQIKECAGRSDYFREKGKKLMEKAKNVGSEFTMNMALSADAAFLCVYCRNDTLQSCLEITPMLSSLKVLLLKYEMKEKYGKDKPKPENKL